MVSLNHLQGENVKAVLEDSLYARPLQVNYFLKNIKYQSALIASCEIALSFPLLFLCWKCSFISTPALIE